jgi:hypothetical protein
MSSNPIVDSESLHRGSRVLHDSADDGALAQADGLTGRPLEPPP